MMGITTPSGLAALVAALFPFAWLRASAGHGVIAAPPPPPPRPRACAQRIFAGSAVPLGLPRGARISLLGPGRITGGDYVAPARLEAPADALVVVTEGRKAGAQSLRVLPAPHVRSTIASVDADCGVTLFDRATLRPLGTFVSSVAPADAAYVPGGLLWNGSTAGTGTRYAAGAGLRPVPLGAAASTLLYARGSRTLIQADRDLDGTPGGTVTLARADGARGRVSVGETPEGLAALGDGRVLITAANGDRVVEIDVRSGRVLRSLAVGERPFGIAVDPGRERAFVALNSIAAMRPSHAGGVAEIDLRAWRVLRVRHDADLALGIALDRARGHLFVTEELGRVLVLDENLRQIHAPLHPCSLPWLPSIDSATHRLFVPCPRKNRVAVYDLTSLRETARLKTAPYPLHVVLP